MAKSKANQPTVTAEAVIPVTPEGSPFKRKVAVMMPTLKIKEGETVYVQITQPIITKQTAVKDDDGEMKLKDISVMNVCNLETGELMQMVPGKALEQNLKDYKGGNQAYVGLSFEITKHKAAEGKRWKPYTLFEIESGEG